MAERKWQSVNAYQMLGVKDFSWKPYKKTIIETVAPYYLHANLSIQIYATF